MNKLDKNIIGVLCSYIFDLDMLRQCSTYFSRTVGMIYFKDLIFNSKNINMNNAYLFREFVHKYKLFINVKNIMDDECLAKFLSYNVKSIHFAHEFEGSYVEYYVMSTFCNRMHYEYLMPSMLQKIEFGRDFNYVIDEGMLPISLKHIIFGDNFNLPLGVNVLPPNLKSLVFGFKFNVPLTKIVFPNSLLHLTFGEYFNQCIESTICEHGSNNILVTCENRYDFINRFIVCEHIFDNKVVYSHILNDDYSKCEHASRTDSLLPPNLTTLILGKEFNKVINVLPSKLEYLGLDQDYQFELDKSITSRSIKILK
jgi:hypothetical protein